MAKTSEPVTKPLLRFNFMNMNLRYPLNPLVFARRKLHFMMSANSVHTRDSTYNFDCRLITI